LDENLDVHSLRRAYVTHLIEDGWDPLFVQYQVGHRHGSTTALYTFVSDQYRTRTLAAAFENLARDVTTGTGGLLPALSGV
jgi:site-specific recombinase XerD